MVQNQNSQLSVVIPVLNERANVRPLYMRLSEALNALQWELIFVDDDSLDDTAAAVRELANSDPRVRLVHRIHRKGLSSACVEGMMASTAPFIAVMDGDLQHDETILMLMLDRMKVENLDIVVGSRHVEGGGMGNFSRHRVILSNLGKWLSLKLIRCNLSDPMSGYFIVRRSYLNLVVRDLSQVGFKILLDLFATSQIPVRFAEVPYCFRERVAGTSKLDASVNLDFILLILDKYVGNWLPPRFILYTVVGLAGVLVHALTLVILYVFAGLDRNISNLAGVALAIIVNFFLNNAVTFRDRRLNRPRSLIRGFVLYAAVCALGAFVTFDFATRLSSGRIPWYLANLLGAAFASVWNFAVGSALTWRVFQHRRQFQQKLKLKALV